MDTLKSQEAGTRPAPVVIPFRAPTSCKVYTPVALASAMIAGIGVDITANWLEPSFGQGAFLKALADFAVPPEKIIAVDVDRNPSEQDHLAISLRGTEFLGWAAHHNFQFDRIVGNPPYVAIERVNARMRSYAASLSWGSIKAIGFDGNLWIAFLLASLPLLRKHGNLTFVLPAAWDYADYAEQLRRELPHYFRRFIVHRAKETLFSQVLDGCVVIQGIDFGTLGGDAIRVDYDSAADLQRGLSDANMLQPKSVYTTNQIMPPPLRRVAASSVINIRLGGVTGDAGFFLLSEAKRKSLRIPAAACLSVLTKAKHLRCAVVNRKYWTSLKRGNERVWLFRPTTKQARLGAVRRYLATGQEDGGCNRDADWVRRRNPWYRVRLPRSVHGFISGTSSMGPWICLNAMPRLAGTNTLYIVQFRAPESKMSERACWALSLLTTDVQIQLRKLARIYPGGMVKYEPADLLSLQLPIAEKHNGALAAYVRAVRYLLAGQRSAATAVADEWFGL